MTRWPAKGAPERREAKEDKAKGSRAGVRIARLRVGDCSDFQCLSGRRFGAPARLLFQPQGIQTESDLPDRLRHTLHPTRRSHFRVTRACSRPETSGCPFSGC